MKTKCMWLILLFLFMPLLVHARWEPTGYKTWKDSTDNKKKKVLVGGAVQNYLTDENRWSQINNNWSVFNDTMFQINQANLKVSATQNGMTSLNIPNQDSIFSLKHTLHEIVLLDTLSDSSYTFLHEPYFSNPAMNKNRLNWNDVFYGISYALIKENGMLHHRISFQPKFLDSLSTWVLKNNRTSSLLLGTVSKYEFNGLETPVPDKRKLRRHILKQSKDEVFQLHQQELFYPGSETEEPIPVFQRWILKNGEYFCIELVNVESVLKIHNNNPTALIYHNASETFDAADVSDTYIRTDNGSFQNYNYGLYSTILLTTELDGSAKRGCFLKFDLSSITAPVTVDSTTLHIAVVAQGDSVGLGYMTTDWSEGNVNSGAVDAEGEYGATWLQAKDSLGTSNDWDWANSSEFSESDFDDNNGNYFGIVDAETTALNAYLHVGSESSGNNSMLVSDWINGRTANYGYSVFDMDLTTGTTIRPSEVVITGFRPYLYVEYTVIEESGQKNQRRRKIQEGAER